MRDSSFGGPRRKAGDCGDAPGIAVLYDGSIVASPVLANGVIRFVGGKTLDSSLGIGFNNVLSDKVFTIDYDQILRGGAGVKIRSCVTPLAKKLRFKCCEPKCGEFGERVSIELQHISTCRNPRTELWVQPFDVYFQCGCTETCCQKLTKLAAKINADENSPAIAEVVNIGTTYYLDLTSKTAGVDFRLVSYEGLTKPDVIVPHLEQNISAGDMQGWFGQDILGPCDANKCMSAIEIWYFQKTEFDEAIGNITSNYDSSYVGFRDVLRHVVVVFDPAVGNSTTARTALITILTASNDEYKKRIASTSTADFATYTYCIIRTDAGDGTALATVREDYDENVISLNRAFYEGGVSYYTLTSTSATPPAPESTGEGEDEVDDVVNLGACGPDDLPCNQPDGCPDPNET